MKCAPAVSSKGSTTQSPPGPREDATDEKLVALALRGDRDAFERLVRRHQRPILNYLCRLTGRREGAMDLAQEVFIRIYVSLGSYNPRYRFTTWLYRIASNCAIDHLRKKQPQTYSLSPPEDDGERAGPGPSLEDRSPTAHDLLRLVELKERLEWAVGTLPVAYRQLILLRHRQHCRYDEIARITGLPIGTVKNRIFRAREILRRNLGDVLDAVPATLSRDGRIARGQDEIGCRPEGDSALAAGSARRETTRRRKPVAGRASCRTRAAGGPP